MASDRTVLLALAQTLTNKTLTSPVVTTPTITSPVINTGVSGTAILDEDDMATDSATQLATQQSIKAFVTSGGVTMTNKRLTAPKLNEDVSVTTTATELNALHSQSVSAADLAKLHAITASASELNTTSDGIGVTIPKPQIIEIGDWNMYVSDTGSASKAVVHGLTAANIRGIVSIYIRDDSNTYQYCIAGYNASNTDAYYEYTDSNSFHLACVASGNFDGADFNATSYNRGWIIVNVID